MAAETDARSRQEPPEERPRRILVVDDDPEAIELVANALHGTHAFAVCGTALDGEEALREIERLSPDVVLLDINMPRLDGLGVLAQLRGDLGSRPDIVVHSNSADPETGREALRLGADGYLEKCYDSRLQHELVRILDGKRRP